MEVATTVFVVDDDQHVRGSLEAVMRSVRIPVETLASAEDFLSAQDRSRCGCIVLDLRMPRMNGLELLEHLRRDGDETPVIFITGHGDVSSAVQAMKAGASDFLEKPFSDSVLVERVRGAIAQDENRRSARQKSEEIRQRLETLTPRERQVMELVVAGRSSKDIAQDLGISLKTVEHHRIHLLDKMRVSTAVDLTREVVAVGLASRPPAGG